MKNYPFLLYFIAILSCNDQQQPKDIIVKKDSVVDKPPVQQTTTTPLTILSFDKKNIPFKDSIKGIIIDGAVFKDNEGESYVVLTELDNGEKEGTQNKSIYAYCFTKQGNAFIKKWLVQDNITGCDVDATCEFLPGSLSITDVDSNNIGETTFIYQLSCKGDVSPHSKKLIMYQGADKFAIRGATILQTPAGKEGGEKKIDDKFGFQKY
jgi:hypothetical protein